MVPAIFHYRDTPSPFENCAYNGIIISQLKSHNEGSHHFTQKEFQDEAKEFNRGSFPVKGPASKKDFEPLRIIILITASWFSPMMDWIVTPARKNYKGRKLLGIYQNTWKTLLIKNSLLSDTEVCLEPSIHHQSLRFYFTRNTRTSYHILDSQNSLQHDHMFVLMVQIVLFMRVLWINLWPITRSIHAT